MAEQQDSTRTRRQYERVKVTRPVKLEATLRGRFIDIMRLEMSGVTIDVSEGGFLANLDQSISPGVRCRVELAGEDGADPKSLWGRVRRTTTGKNGFVVALEFDEPVQAAEMLGGGAEAVLAVSEDNGSDNGGSESVEAADDAADEKDTAQKKRKSRKGAGSKGPARKKTG